jgi:hypothetical protein
MMENRKFSSCVSVMVAVLLTLSATLAFAAPMKPEVAAKKQNYDKQKAQQVTPGKRKVAVDGLKAERMKIYKAKQDALKSKNGTVK